MRTAADLHGSAALRTADADGEIHTADLIGRNRRAYSPLGSTPYL
ncbi:hypothetical protein [Methylotenera versatilis]|nr:hypothetical protein [Methylotenera versatilis]